MVEILNYDEQPAGSYAVAIFDVHFRIPLRMELIGLNRLKLIRSKNSNNLFIGYPSACVKKDIKPDWIPYSVYEKEDEKKMTRSILEMVSPMASRSAPRQPDESWITPGF